MALETFGRYELLRKLASGGMGEVFLARQKGPVGFQKLLVVKRILPHLSEEDEFIRMFYDEARIAALLNHPNIAQLYELGDVDGVHFVAMEYVQGDSLHRVNARAVELKGELPLGLKCRILADAAAGLDFAHHARSPSGRPLELIHRDVSPQNVLVGYTGAVKLIDFGVARAANRVSHTLTGAIKGKYAYMSPEQALGQELDRRSDVFGLGILLHELLTTSRLFKRESEHATMKAVVGAKIAPPSSLVKVPKALDAIVMKALARNREERFQSAGDFQLALEEFLMHQRLPGTNAHLAALLRELYSEELSDAISNEPTVIHYVTPELSRSSPKAPSRTSPRSRSAPKEGEVAEPSKPSRSVPGRKR